MKVKLGEVSVLINGDRGKNYPSQADILSDGDIPFVNAGHLDGRSIRLDEMSYITFEKYNQLSSGKFRKGDILYCLRGSLGKKAVVQEIVEGAIASSLVIIRPDSQIIDVNYLMLALDSPCIQNQLLKANNGSSQPNLSAASVRAYEIDLPNKKVQEEIVNKFDKIQRVIDARKQQLQKLDELVKSRFVEMFGAIQEMVPLSYYIRGLSAGKSLAGEDECVNKVLKTGATTYDYFDSAQVKNLPLDYIPQEEHRVKTGDVIISRMNTAELVGAAAYVWEAPDHTYLPDRLWKAEVRDTACPIFVWQLLIQKDTKESIRRIASGTSGSMKNISKPGLLGIRVIKAEVATQNRFAAFVAEVDKSKLAVQQSLEKLETLKKSLMQQYFG